MLNYHDLEAYKLARVLVATIYSATSGSEPPPEDDAPADSTQELRRAAVAITVHLLDCGPRSTPEQDRRSLERSLKELGHMGSCIEKVRDAGHLTPESATWLLDMKAQVGEALNSSVRSLSPSPS